MDDPSDRLANREFRQLMRRRSLWRWGLSALVIVSYLVYSVAGVYLADVYSKPFFGSALPWGLALGYLIIFASIALSILYVRVANRLESDEDSS